MATYYVTTSGSDSNSGLSEALAFATPGYAAGQVSALGGDTIYIKSGTYLLSTTTTNVSGGRVNPAAGVRGAPNRIIGYQATVGDLDGDSDVANYPILRATSSGNDVPFQISNSWIWAANLVGDCDNHAGYAWNVNGQNFQGVNLKGMKANSYAFNVTTRSTFYRCWATQSGGGVYSNADRGALFAFRIDGNTGAGLVLDDARSAVVRCLIVNNTGTSSDGILLHTGEPVGSIIGCTIHGNGRDGIRADNTNSVDMNLIQGNLITSNGGYGINTTVTTYGIVYPTLRRNFFRSNTSGDYSGLVAGSDDVTLTADPYTNASTGDFTLNNTSGGGAACRGVGAPYNLLGESGRTSDGDAGMYQSSGSGGGTTVVYQVVSPGILWGTS